MYSELTKHDLLYHPNDVQPIGSIKGVRNKPTKQVINITNKFLDPDNLYPLLSNVYVIYQQNGGKIPRQQFKQIIQQLAVKFAAENNLSEYSTADYQATQVLDYTYLLKTINHDFIQHCYKYFRWNVMNPFKQLYEVGDQDNRGFKKGYEFTHQDKQTLDLWREQFTQVLNNKYRDNNRIPVYRSSIHTRHYDTTNEGLQNQEDSDRASLETPIYGYDMSEIYKNLDKYKSEEWYSM